MPDAYKTRGNHVETLWSHMQRLVNLCKRQFDLLHHPPSEGLNYQHHYYLNPDERLQCFIREAIQEQQ